MNDQYPIGTVCIGQNLSPTSGYNGKQCEILGGLQMRRWYADDGETGESRCYHVRWVTGEETHQEHRELKLPPPKHKEWADEAVRKLKKQSSDHVAGGSKVLIPEETV